MKKFIFNPDYALRTEENYMLLYSKSSRFQYFNGDDNVITKIHPLHAVILSQFDGCSFEKGLEKIAKNLFVEKKSSQYEKIKKFVCSCINNNHQYSLKDPSANYIFPRNLLIDFEENNNMSKLKETPNFYYDFISKGKTLDLNKRPKFPIDIVIMPTTNCGTNCIYCYANRSKKMNATISTERYKEIILEAKKMNARMVDVIGGDIFAYPKWYELLSILKECGYHKECLLSTKIPLNEDAIKKLHSTGIERLQLSIDSLLPDSIKSILRVSNAESYIEKMKNTLNLLRKYAIKVSVHTILTAQGATKKDLISVYNKLKTFNNIYEWRIDVAFSSMFSDVPYSDYKVGNNDIKRISEVVNSLSKKEKNIRIVNEIDEVNVSLSKKRDVFLYEKAISCPANVFSCFILPDGKVTICEQFYWKKEYIIGDITKQSLYEIWNSKKALDLYYRKTTQVQKTSPCYDCSDKEECSNRKLICWVDVVKTYGYENWDYPDPRCPNALSCDTEKIITV